MRVIATQKGYYGERRIKVGQKFVLSDEKHFSKRWMEKLPDAPAEIADLETARAKFEELAKEPPAADWSLKTLRKKIAKLLAPTA